MQPLANQRSTQVGCRAPDVAPAMLTEHLLVGRGSILPAVSAHKGGEPDVSPPASFPEIAALLSPSSEKKATSHTILASSRLPHLMSHPALSLLSLECLLTYPSFHECSSDPRFPLGKPSCPHTASFREEGCPCTPGLCSLLPAPTLSAHTPSSSWVSLQLITPSCQSNPVQLQGPNFTPSHFKSSPSSTTAHPPPPAPGL